MANLFMDSFDHYAIGDILQKYTSSSGGSIVSARTNNGLSGVASLQKALTAGDATCIVGAAIKWTALNKEIFSVGDGGVSAITSQVYLSVLTDGSLELRRGSSAGTILGTSAVGLIATGSFYFIELKVLVGNSGTYDVRINNVSVLSGSGDTQNTAVAQWTIVQFGGGTGTVVDDFYINDGTGSINNNFWGDTRIDVVYPDGDGASSGWTPSTGTTHYTLIDEAAPNGDTDYNSTATINAIDEVTMQNTPVPDNTIRSVQALASVKKTDAGAATMAIMARQDSVDYVATTASPGTAYAYVRQVYERAPDTSIWTATIFNAMEFGYKRLS